MVESGIFLAAVARSWASGGTEDAKGEEAGFDVGKPLTLTYYKNQEWARQYFEEYERVWESRSLSYEPYVTWRSRPFRGETINIDEQGWRRTPGSECGSEAYVIFMFGGSTMWGYGVPDWGTIPAQVQAEISARSGPQVCVMNLAEQAYVSTQSVVELLLELRAGSRPDLVVFYDGINDVFAAYQSGLPGVHQNLGTIAARFEERPEAPPLIALLARTRTFKLVHRIVTGNKYGSSPGGPIRPGSNVSGLALGIKEIYAGNAALVARLGKLYGFEAVFFWQPVLLLEEKPLTAEERIMQELAVSVYPELEEVFRQSYEEIEKLSQERSRIRNFARIFDDEASLVYVDPWHVTEEGNRRIAKEIVGELGPILEDVYLRSPRKQRADP